MSRSTFSRAAEMAEALNQAETDEALAHLDRVLEGRFEIYRKLTRTDPWLDSIRSHADFDELLVQGPEKLRPSQGIVRGADGDRLLGVGIPS